MKVRIRPFSLPALLWLAATGSLFLMACDNSFEPITDDPSTFFSIFGYLDSGADTQFVRVSPLRPMIGVGPGDLHATVVSTRLADDQEVAWRDSLVQLDDGTTGLLFYTLLPVRPGEAYRVDIRSPGAALTQAMTRLPEQVPLEPGSLQRNTTTQQFVQRVLLVGLDQPPHRLAVRYEVAPSASSEPVTMTFPLSDGGEPTDEGLEVIVPLSANRLDILRRLDRPEDDSTLTLVSLALEIEQLSDEWRMPERPANIRNGFGFFGSVARYVQSWMLPADVIRTIGFQPATEVATKMP